MPTTAETSGTTDQVAPWYLAGLSGLLAAGVALGVAELLAGFSPNIPSLVESVGDWVIENGFESLDRWSRDTFGTNQKSALVTGITIASLVLGFITGIASRRDIRFGIGVFVGFAIVGGLAAAQDELANASGGWFAAIAAGASGAISLVWLLRAAGERLPADGSLGSVGRGIAERRRFLVAGGGAAFIGVFGAGLGSSLRNSRTVEGERAEVAAELASDPPPSSPASANVATFDDVPGVSRLVTPNDEFYLIDTALSPPLIDPDDWTLRVAGMVDEPYELTFDELLAMNVVEAPVTLSCVSNEVGGNLVGNAIWRGVPLADVLERAGVSDGATQIVGRSLDGWTAGFPTDVALDGRTSLVAFAMNGEPLPVKHGFPVRLVVAGLYGYVSATKWLTELELTTWEDFDGFWVSRGWAKEGPVKTQSRIDVPRSGSQLRTGPQPIAGVAWAPDRSIDKVEVRIDGGDWLAAQLSDELSGDSWRQWLHEWDATPGDHVIEVRATDGTGEAQTSDLAAPRPDGATGWHTRAVTVEDV